MYNYSVLSDYLVVVRLSDYLVVTSGSHDLLKLP
jgi:hypothetical protein